MIAVFRIQPLGVVVQEDGGGVGGALLQRGQDPLPERSTL